MFASCECSFFDSVVFEWQTVTDKSSRYPLVRGELVDNEQYHLCARESQRRQERHLLVRGPIACSLARILPVRLSHSSFPFHRMDTLSPQPHPRHRRSTPKSHLQHHLQQGRRLQTQWVLVKCYTNSRGSMSSTHLTSSAGNTRRPSLSSAL